MYGFSKMTFLNATKIEIYIHFIWHCLYIKSMAYQLIYQKLKVGGKVK